MPARRALLSLAVLIPAAQFLNGAAPPPAQQAPSVRNSRVETRAATGLEREFRSLADAAGPAPGGWIGYSVPAIRRASCSTAHNCSTYRDDKGGSITLSILYKVEQKRVTGLRYSTEGCEFDAEGLPLTWLTGVRPAESVAFLSGLASMELSGTGEMKRLPETALSLLAIHSDPAVGAALEQFAAPGQREELRKRAVFWLGSAGGRRGFEAARRIAREDASESVRDRAIFALSQSEEADAIPTLLEMARQDKSPKVRGRAVFWLAEKAGKRATAALAEAVASDPELEVKRQALFALTRLPADEGVPKLIEIARTHRHPEIRRQAMFWLGRSNDSRALTFFEQVLTR